MPHACNLKTKSYKIVSILESVHASKPKIPALKVLKNSLNRNLYFWVWKPVQKHVEQNM